MANNSTVKTTSTGSKATAKTTSKAATKTIAKSPEQAEGAISTAPIKKTLRLKDLDVNELVEVQSICYGQLHYISKEGYMVDWSEFGDVQLIPVGELLKMRNQQPAFFTHPWIKLIGDGAEDVIEYLQIGKYYTVIDNIREFDDIFSYDVADFEALVSKLSDSMKEAVARRAYALKVEGTLDSRKMIEAVERVTNYSLDD